MPPTKKRSSYSVEYPPGCRELEEGLKTDELLRRLKLIAKALQSMDQDSSEKYKPLALWLGSDIFLKHPSADVRLLVACCVADIFRVFAPDAPYTDNIQLMDILKFLTEQLVGLEETDGKAFRRYLYLLENLALVKTFNICLGMEDQDFICTLFKTLLSVVSAEHSSKVTGNMLDVLCPLILEAEAVSPQLLDILLGYTIEPSKSDNRPAYNFVRDLIRRAANAVEPSIQSFLNNVLILGQSESELSHRVYELIYELNHIAPSLLLAVLPQMELKLKDTNDSERKTATRILGRMFAEPETNIVAQHHPLWLAYLSRFNDARKDIRTICVQASSTFLLHHPDLAKDISEQLEKRLHDVDEEIRLEAVTTVLGTCKKNLAAVSDSLLHAVRDRTLDKRYKIRSEALTGLAELYKRVTCGEGVQQDLRRLAWVPNRVLRHYYLEAMEDKLLVERKFFMCLVPYSLEAETRMKQLLGVYCSLESQALKAFNEIFRIQKMCRQYVGEILQLVEDPDAEDLDEKIGMKIIQVRKMVPETPRGQEQLKKFFNLLREDARIRRSVSRLLAPDCTCSQAQDAVRDVCKKLGNPTSSNQLYGVSKCLLERCSPILFDQSSVCKLTPLVLRCVRGEMEDVLMSPLSNTGRAEVPHQAMQLLLVVSQVFPGSFQTASVYNDLIACLKHSHEEVSHVALQIFSNAGMDVQQRFPKVYSRLLPALLRGARQGSAREAKHSVLCIKAMCQDKLSVFSQLFEELEQQASADHKHCLSAVVSLGHITYLCPDEFSTQMRSLVARNIVRDILMQDKGEMFGLDEDDMPLSPKKKKKPSKKVNEEFWCEVDELSLETRTKLRCLKMMVHWLLGARSNDSNSASSTLRLLFTMLAHKGDLMERNLLSNKEKAHLRLRAGCCMLKLAQEPVYRSLITQEYFHELALLINDEVYQVRFTFSQKLHKGLLQMRLPLQYMAVFCLAANDPVKDRRQVVKHYLQTNISRRRDVLKRNSLPNNKLAAILPDFVLPYAVHLLAHDPDFVSYENENALKEIKECLWFILEPLVFSDNVNFLRRMLETIKMTRDAMNPDDEDMHNKLYAVCDLAYLLLGYKVTHVTLEEFPTDVMLPADLFTRPNMMVHNTRIYLPDSLRTTLQRKQVVPRMPVKGKARAADTSNPQGKLAAGLKSPGHTYSRALGGVASPVSIDSGSPVGALQPKQGVKARSTARSKRSLLGKKARHLRGEDDVKSSDESNASDSEPRTSSAASSPLRSSAVKRRARQAASRNHRALTSESESSDEDDQSVQSVRKTSVATPVKRGSNKSNTPDSKKPGIPRNAGGSSKSPKHGSSPVKRQSKLTGRQISDRRSAADNRKRDASQSQSDAESEVSSQKSSVQSDGRGRGSALAKLKQAPERSSPRGRSVKAAAPAAKKRKVGTQQAAKRSLRPR